MPHSTDAALRHRHCFCTRQRDEKRLLLYLGIDEYQLICYLPSIDSTSALITLLNIFIGYMSYNNTILFPIFAGTSFAKSTRSSNVICQYIPLTLLSMKQAITAILSIPNVEENLLWNDAVYRRLFTLGVYPDIS